MVVSMGNQDFMSSDFHKVYLGKTGKKVTVSGYDMQRTAKRLAKPDAAVLRIPQVNHMIRHSLSL